MKLIFCFIIIGCSVIIIPSCRKQKHEYKGIIISIYEGGDCFNKKNAVFLCESGCVVNDSSFFKGIIGKMICDSDKILPIDFNNYTLLALGYVASWSNYTKITSGVIDDASSRKYIYTMEISPSGSHKKIIYLGEWILVPKLPQGYKVKFVIKEKGTF